MFPLGTDCSCRVLCLPWFSSSQFCTWLPVNLPLSIVIFQEGKILQTASCDQIHCYLILDGIPVCDLETIGRKMNPFFSCLCFHPSILWKLRSSLHFYDSSCCSRKLHSCLLEIKTPFCEVPSGSWNKYDINPNMNMEWA